MRTRPSISLWQPAGIGEADARHSVPVWHGTPEPTYFTTEEYAGGYDQVDLTIAKEADYVETNLYYQTTSREYVEFLRDEINGNTNTLSSPTPSGESEAYVVQTDPFFAQLKGWGDTIWQLWSHNMNVDGAAPFLMTQATYGTAGGCAAPAPSLLSATPAHTEVALVWSDESADPSVAGYKVYYDQAGKAQLIVGINDPTATTYTDTGLTDGVEYCYKVTSYYDATCESGFSNISCATPENQGQTTDPAGVSVMNTGKWVTEGKGPNKTTTFTTTDTFTVGDSVVIRAYVEDNLSGQPVANATVEITVGGPETVTLNSGPSGADGWAEATWNTQKPNKREQGGTTPGDYTASTTNVTATGYHWDGVTTHAIFTMLPLP